MYIGDNTKNGDTVGYARDPNTGYQTLQNNHRIGCELDLVNELQIYRNLTFKFWGGYLWSGAALDMFNLGTGTNFSPHNPWAIRTRLMYTF